MIFFFHGLPALEYGLPSSNLPGGRLSLAEVDFKDESSCLSPIITHKENKDIIT